MSSRNVCCARALPDDAWTTILGRLSLRDQCAAALVCRQLARVAAPLIILARPVCLTPGGLLPKHHVHHLFVNKFEVDEGLAVAARALAGCTTDVAHFSGDDALISLEKLVTPLARVSPARLPSISLHRALLCGPNPDPDPTRKRAELSLWGCIASSARPGLYFRGLRLFSHIGDLPPASLQGLSCLALADCRLETPTHLVGLEALTVLDLTDVSCTKIVLADLPLLEELRVAGTTVHSLTKCPRLARVLLRFRGSLLRADAPVLASLSTTCADPHWSLRAVHRDMCDCVLGDVPTLPDLKVLHAVRTFAKSLCPQPALRELVVTDNHGPWRWDELPLLESCELRGMCGKTSLGPLPRLRRLTVRDVFSLKTTPVHLYPLLEELTLVRTPNPIPRAAILPHLRVLVLKDCPRMSTRKLSAPALKVLHLRACPGYDLASDAPLTRFAHIRRADLDLPGCPPMGLLSVRCDAEAPALRELRLQNVSAPLDVGHIPSLRRLEVDRRLSLPATIAAMPGLDLLRVDKVELAYRTPAATARYYHLGLGAWIAREAHPTAHCALRLH